MFLSDFLKKREAEKERIGAEQEQPPEEQEEDTGQAVWFFVEHRDGKPEEGALKLAVEVGILASKLRSRSYAVVIGHGIRTLPEHFGPYGTDNAFIVEDQHLATYDGEVYVDILEQLAQLYSPSIFLFAATTLGNDLAPRLAARLKTSFAARYTEIDVDDEGNLSVRRSIHDGNAQATVTALNRPLIGTIDTQSLGLQKPKAIKTTQVIEPKLRIPARSSKTKVIDYMKADPCAVCVSEAEIVIGVGKGLGSVENLHSVEELAQVLGASIGGSRRATDEHWIADERRIGMTGKTISPRLYLICGISGAFHHTLSIKGSQLKVVVNTDEKAPIVKMADLTVVGDMQQIIPELTKQLREILKPAT